MREAIVRGSAWMAAAALLCGGSAQGETLTLTHQSIERTAILHRPAAGSERPRALVIALHGLGGTGANFRRWAGFDAVADREGFVVAYPDAVARQWSYGRPIIGPMPTVKGETVDDVGFLGTLIDRLVSQGIADPARVYVMGMSRGALMTFTAACALADRIAAAAAVASSMTEPQRQDCRPVRPVPMLVIAGTADHAQNYDGWLYPDGRLLSVPETIEYWRALHGCSKQESRLLPHRDEQDPTGVVVVEWSPCRSGAQLRFYRIEGGGHRMPSIAVTDTPMTEQRFGRRNRDIEAAEEIWSFFKGNTR